MSSLVRQTRQLERVIRRKEKIFLMEQYAASMLQQLEPIAEEGQDDELVIEALRIAYRYVNPELGARLSALLLAYGYSGDLEAEREAAEEAENESFSEEEADDEAPPSKAKKGKTRGPGAGPVAEGEEDEEAGALFERDIYTGRKSPDKSRKAAGTDEDEDASDLFADEDSADDLFADGDDSADAEADDPKTAKRKKSKTKKSAGTGTDDDEDAADLFADEDSADDLFADEDDSDDAEADDPKTAKNKKSKTKKSADTDDEAEDAADLFGDGENEDAGALLEQDIYTSGKKKKKKRRNVQEADGEAEDQAEDAGEEDKARRFKPTQGHAHKETPGFAAPEGAVERDEKSRRGRDLYAPEEETGPATDAKAKVRKKPRSLDAEEEAEEEEEEAKEARPRKAPRAAGEEEKEEKNKKEGKDALAADAKGDEKTLNLDALTYQVAVDDLRTQMGLTLVREDAVKLMRRWEQKSRTTASACCSKIPKPPSTPTP